eukprot:RCo048187
MSTQPIQGAKPQAGFKVAISKLHSVNRAPMELAWQPVPAQNPQVSFSVKATWHIPLDETLSDFSNFKIGGQIGRGTQAVVRKFQNTVSHIIYAMKTTIMEEKTDNMLQRELQDTFKNLQHENVVKIVAIFIISPEVHVVMEYMNVGSLEVLISILASPLLLPSDYEGIFPEPILSCITRQTLSGLQFLHANKIIHRDLKPSNVLVNSHGVVKIADFGCSKALFKTSQFTSTILGSEAYMSPERVRGDPHNNKADIWSLGLTVAHCALGMFPLVDPREQKLSSGVFHSQPANIFSLSVRLKNNQAVVDFPRIIEQIAALESAVRKPVPPSDALKLFVWITMSQSGQDRPPCAELLNHAFIKDHLSTTAEVVRGWLAKYNLRELAKRQSKAPDEFSSSASSMPTPTTCCSAAPATAGCGRGSASTSGAGSSPK